MVDFEALTMPLDANGYLDQIQHSTFNKVLKNALGGLLTASKGRHKVCKFELFSKKKFHMLRVNFNALIFVQYLICFLLRPTFKHAVIRTDWTGKITLTEFNRKRREDAERSLQKFVYLVYLQYEKNILYMISFWNQFIPSGGKKW